MNERIKQLMSQTALHRNDHTTEQRLAEVEKFAELIVLECASIVENQGRFLTYLVLSKEVKKRLGIKE